MEQQKTIKASERAMFYGTLFGLYTIITNIAYITGLRVPFCSTLFLVLFIASPFVAGKLAATFRKREAGNRISYAQAWFFLLTMYLCSAILTAIAQFIYFLLIDNGFFMEFIQEQFAQIASMEGIDEAMKEQFAATATLLKAMSPREIIMQIFSTNIIVSPFITAIIAIFVRKK